MSYLARLAQEQQQPAGRGNCGERGTVGRGGEDARGEG